jgi:hypothetical protein
LIDEARPLAMDLIIQGAKMNPEIAKKQKNLCQILEVKVEEHHQFIMEHGDDPEEVKLVSW